jgi:hypothetical protein
MRFAKLGHDVSKDTVTKYMPKRPGAPHRPPSTTWGTFLRTLLAGTIAIDFLTVPTVTFNVLYVFFVLSLERRRILHVYTLDVTKPEQIAAAVRKAGESGGLLDSSRRWLEDGHGELLRGRGRAPLDRDGVASDHQRAVALATACRASLARARAPVLQRIGGV